MTGLGELTKSWHERAGAHIAIDGQPAWAAGLLGRRDAALLGTGDLSDEELVAAAEAVLAEVAGRGATFGRLNLLAEAHRVLHGVAFASAEDRIAVAEAVTERAVAASFVLTPPPLCHTPAQYVRADGTSRLRPTHHVLYTSRAVIDAEARLLEAGREEGGPAVGAGSVAAVAAGDLPGRDHNLGFDQATAVEQVATSGRVLDVLVGPSGSGKSSAMAGVRAAWEAE